MLSGYNTNVRHRGLVLHVQTEDSGLAHPHVITHLYHGGTILASERSQYADLLGAPDSTDRVRELMEQQHRAMLLRLKRGELDARLAERLGGEIRLDETGGATAAGETGPAAGASEPACTLPASERSERSLDEVVLEYLQESASRERGKPR
ncbi:hypothetical protein GPROT1_02447 [Gammaproteobacteria bacterium]|jgi:hypothetical protein|nr:hypothetical protein GPROT1_02447 [Gammaproteobacteria bacterium]